MDTFNFLAGTGVFSHYYSFGIKLHVEDDLSELTYTILTEFTAADRKYK